MKSDMSPTGDGQQQVAEATASALETAWNRADAGAFAALFAADADFVNVRGDHAVGREAIAAGHAHIWATIYAGSTVRYSVTRQREIAPGVVLVHLDALLRVPSGPLAGEIRALPSLLLTHSGGEWLIAAFQNTQVAAR
jgi:uncharacterized protein (TIGR02246 family)